MLKVISFDLDGTLIRKGLDDVFWHKLIHELFAERNKISFKEAQKFLLEEYDRIGSEDPRWYVPEYWFERFGLEANISDILSRVKYAEGVYDDVRLIGDLHNDYTIVI